MQLFKVYVIMTYLKKCLRSWCFWFELDGQKREDYNYQRDGQDEVQGATYSCLLWKEMGLVNSFWDIRKNINIKREIYTPFQIGFN